MDFQDLVEFARGAPFPEALLAADDSLRAPPVVPSLLAARTAAAAEIDAETRDRLLTRLLRILYPTVGAGLHPTHFLRGFHTRRQDNLQQFRYPEDTVNLRTIPDWIVDCEAHRKRNLQSSARYVEHIALAALMDEDPEPMHFDPIIEDDMARYTFFKAYPLTAKDGGRKAYSSQRWMSKIFYSKEPTYVKHPVLVATNSNAALKDFAVCFRSVDEYRDLSNYLYKQAKLRLNCFERTYTFGDFLGAETVADSKLKCQIAMVVSTHGF